VPDDGIDVTAPRSDHDIRTAAVAVLATGDARAKAAKALAVAAAWRAGELGTDRDAATAPPERPARPARPVLVQPGAVPRRRVNSAPAGRIALLHALAHIELNAIDLAWDMLARFSSAELPRRFIDDWVSVGAEEAQHFIALADRLEALGTAYGDLPAHDGLWLSALATAHDLAARLAVVPLVLEARGLDVTPTMAVRLRRVGDAPSADILDTIYREEIGHVAIGQRWFSFVCAARGAEPRHLWQNLVGRYFHGTLKRPFNEPGRDAAGLPESWYAALAKP
jgi:uncharacterized ferritin-like protein (DUF455 family)